MDLSSTHVDKTARHSRLLTFRRPLIDVKVSRRLLREALLGRKFQSIHALSDIPATLVGVMHFFMF
jgi:hypothetical protein